VADFTVPIARGRISAAIGTVSAPSQVVIIDSLLRQKSDRVTREFRRDINLGDVERGREVALRDTHIADMDMGDGDALLKKGCLSTRP
jgi:hypothetical protein